MHMSAYVTGLNKRRGKMDTISFEHMMVLTSVGILICCAVVIFTDLMLEMFTRKG